MDLNTFWFKSNHYTFSEEECNFYMNIFNSVKTSGLSIENSRFIIKEFLRDITSLVKSSNIELL